MAVERFEGSQEVGDSSAMVREAVLSAVPVSADTGTGETEAGTGDGLHRCSFWKADKPAPRKQRHTAHRIWCRIRNRDAGSGSAESTIRRQFANGRSR